MPGLPRPGNAAVRIGDKVLIAGGGWNATRDSLLFDGQTFKAGPNLIMPRTFGAGTVLADGRVLISGGVPNQVTPGAELYLPLQNKFIAVKGAFIARRHH